MIILRNKYYSDTLGRFLVSVNKGLLRKPKIKSYRNAINTENKILNKTAKTINEIKDAYIYPGKAINKGIKETIKNPVTMSGVIAGKVTDITNPESIAIPKSTIAALIGNKVLPKNIRNKLEKQAEKYGNSKVARTINNIPPAPNIVNMIGGSLGM